MSDYGVLWGASLPGCLVDSTRYNINGTGVCKDETILIGKAVGFGGIVDGYRMVTADLADSLMPFGVALRSHDCLYKDEQSGYMAYRSGEPMNVVTRGRVWVLTKQIEEAPQHGEPVYVLEDGFVGKDSGVLPGGWTFTGDFFKMDRQINIVGVSILPAAGEQVLPVALP